MARTKLIARANYNLRRENYQRLRVSSGIKNIEGRIRNRDIKIKQIIPQCRNIEVKQKNGQVVTRMTVRSKTIFPRNRPVQY